MGREKHGEREGGRWKRLGGDRERGHLAWAAVQERQFAERERQREGERVSEREMEMDGSK